MKRVKIGLILQASFMAMQMLLFWGLVLLWRLVPDLPDAFSLGTFIGIIVFQVLALLSAVITLILSLTSLFDQAESPYRFCFILKCLLIPWYISNLLYWMTLGGAFANPFLMLAVPFVLFWGITYTYLLFLGINIPTIVYIIRSLATKKVQAKALTIWSLVLQFLYIGDYVGSAMLFFREQYEKNNEGSNKSRISIK